MRGSKRQRKKKLYGTRRRRTLHWQIKSVHDMLMSVLAQIPKETVRTESLDVDMMEQVQANIERCYQEQVDEDYVASMFVRDES